VGEYKVTLTNPSSSSPRTVTFSWLLGRDADDAFTARGGVPGRGLSRGGTPGGAGGPDLRNASDLLSDMLARVSRVHKSLDEVVAWQQFVDVRFARSMNSAGLTSGRVQWWTLLESSIIILLAVVQTYLIQQFEIKGQYIAMGPGGGGAFQGFSARGAGAGRLAAGGSSRNQAEQYHKV